MHSNDYNAREKNELIKKIRAKGIEIISEIELAYRHKGDSKVIAITGSNGKTTTTSLIYHICKTANLDCALVGNIGFSFAKQVAIEPKPLYVVEISSFQLDDIKTFKPDVAVLTNITEDHLDRYEYNIKNYINSKFKIIQNQTQKDVFIYSLDDETTNQNITNYSIQSTLAPFTMSKQLPQGAYLLNAKMHLKWKNEEMQMNISDFAIKGKHNQYNSMAASLAATVVDIRKEKIREALQTFESLEHRMEPVVTIKGVEFINDSKATNVDAAKKALLAFKSILWIVGGESKEGGVLPLKPYFNRIKKAYVIGTDVSDLIKDLSSIDFVIAGSISEAVRLASLDAEKNDVVLLAPACASFDQYENFEKRGDDFINNVMLVNRD